MPLIPANIILDTRSLVVSSHSDIASPTGKLCAISRPSYCSPLICICSFSLVVNRSVYTYTYHRSSCTCHYSSDISLRILYLSRLIPYSSHTRICLRLRESDVKYLSYHILIPSHTHPPPIPTHLIAYTCAITRQKLPIKPHDTKTTPQLDIPFL